MLRASVMLLAMYLADVEVRDKCKDYFILPPSKFHRRTSLGKVFKFYRRTAPACC